MFDMSFMMSWPGWAQWSFAVFMVLLLVCFAFLSALIRLLLRVLSIGIFWGAVAAVALWVMKKLRAI